MEQEKDQPSPIGDGWRGTNQESRTLSRRLRRISIANIIRTCRRPDGRELGDVAVATRVRGTTLTEVREVRKELEANGVLQDEIDGPPEGGEVSE